MAIFNKGLSANPRPSIGEESVLLDGLLSKNSTISAARVTDVILDKNYPKIENLGGDNAIGTIFFEMVNQDSSNINQTARPFFPQISSIPLVNEIVLILKLPNSTIGKTYTNTSYYYLNMVNLWNNPHHNAFPDPNLGDDTPDSQAKSYEQIENGSPSIIDTTGETIYQVNLNSPVNTTQQTFKERDDIHPLLPFAGDIIHQGRWGNSIRLSSTSPNGDPRMLNLNDWSSVGDNGDPITIFRNGQNPDNKDSGYVHTVEDINKDLSSIYMTSTQLIPLTVTNRNYRSYTDSLNFPKSPSTFHQPQIIFNSDRLVLNSKKDHILISSAKSIFLGSNTSFNVSTKEAVIDSRNIKLGSKDATEPIILGNKFLSNLEVIMKELSTLCGAISAIQEVTWVNPETGEPNKINAVNGQLKVIADNLSNMIEGGGIGFIDQMESYKSNVNKIL